MQPRVPFVNHLHTADGAFSLPLVFSCWVPGQPQTKGSARAYTYRRSAEKGGGFGARIDNDNPKAKAWQAKMREHAESAMRSRCVTANDTAAFGLKVEFVFERPSSHVLSRQTKQGLVVKLSASGRRRLHHTTKPDVDKAVRVVLDALTGVLYKDDSQVVDTIMSKRYAPLDGSGSGVMIEAYMLNHAERWMPEAQR